MRSPGKKGSGTNCKLCRKLFSKKHNGQIFCSDTCKVNFYKHIYIRKNNLPYIVYYNKILPYTLKQIKKRRKVHGRAF
jgi:hypothetical protein